MKVLVDRLQKAKYLTGVNPEAKTETGDAFICDHELVVSKGR